MSYQNIQLEKYKAIYYDPYIDSAEKDNAVSHMEMVFLPPTQNIDVQKWKYISWELVDKLTKENLNNASLFKLISDILNAIINDTQKTKPIILSEILGMNKVLGKGAYGVVADMKLGQFGVIKTVVNMSLVDKRSDLLHDYIVGLKLNKLRKYTPTFAYVYSVFASSESFVSQEKNVSWRSEKVDGTPYYNYLIMENIDNAETVKSAMSNLTIDKFDHILLQVTSALMKAYDLFEVMHNDLHPGNVLLQTTKEPINVLIGKSTKSTKLLARIIDYGQGSFYEKGELYMKQVNYRKLKNNMPQLGDIYKFLIFCADRCVAIDNKKLFDYINSIYIDYFYQYVKKDLTDIIDNAIVDGKRVDRYRYSSHLGKKNDGRNLHDFYKYLDKSINKYKYLYPKKYISPKVYHLEDISTSLKDIDIPTSILMLDKSFVAKKEDKPKIELDISQVTTVDEMIEFFYQILESVRKLRVYQDYFDLSKEWKKIEKVLAEVNEKVIDMKDENIDNEDIFDELNEEHIHFLAAL